MPKLLLWSKQIPKPYDPFTDDELVGHYDPVCKFIDTGFLIQFRRRLKRLFLISKGHPLCVKLVKSSTAIRSERYRHLFHYYYAIHPFSDFCLYWQFCMLIVYGTSLLIIPWEMSSNRQELKWWHNLGSCIMDVLQSINIILLFFIGRYDKSTSRVCMNIRTNSLKYLSTFFFFDLLSVVPTIAFPLLILNQDAYFEYGITYFHMLKITRLFTFVKLLNALRQFLRLSLSFYKILRIILLFGILFQWIFIIGWLCSEFFHIATMSREKHIFVSLLYIIQVGSVKFQKEDGVDNFTILALISFYTFAGTCYITYILCQAWQLYRIYAGTSNKYDEVLKQLEHYMNYKKLHGRLRQKIYDYFNFRYQKCYFNQIMLMDSLGGNLREEILTHNTTRLLTKVDFFQHLPTFVQRKLIIKLKHEVFWPNDVIINAGDVGKCMYFIDIGSVAVYTPTGKEVCHLADGEHFGEIALFLNETRMANVMAISPCEIYKLYKNDFMSIMEAHPNLYLKIYNLAMSRMQTTTLIG